MGEEEDRKKHANETNKQIKEKIISYSLVWYSLTQRQ